MKAKLVAESSVFKPLSIDEISKKIKKMSSSEYFKKIYDMVFLESKGAGNMESLLQIRPLKQSYQDHILNGIETKKAELKNTMYGGFGADTMNNARRLIIDHLDSIKEILKKNPPKKNKWFQL